MIHTIVSLFARRKGIFAAVGLLVLVAAWWAFRPEKLFINERVNEPAPFLAASDPLPVLTGGLENGAHATIGRATIYKTPEGRRYLSITGLSASAAELRVALEGVGPKIDLGPLRSSNEQNFDLAVSADLNQYDRVAIYADHADTFAMAKLEPF
jgi:hypothetical protein